MDSSLLLFSTILALTAVLVIVLVLYTRSVRRISLNTPVQMQQQPPLQRRHPLVVVLFIALVVFGYKLWPLRQFLLPVVFGSPYEKYQNQDQQQRDELVAHTFVTHAGDGFSIGIPPSWSEDSSGEVQQSAFAGVSGAKEWGMTTTNASVLAGTASTLAQAGVIITWGPDTSHTGIDEMEDQARADAENFPTHFATSSPAVPGAEGVFMSVPAVATTTAFWELFAHSHGTVYEVFSSTDNFTPEDAAGLRAIFATFTLKN